MKFLIHDVWHEWGESVDIIEYCNKNNFQYEILSSDELLSRKDFFSCIYFCDTNIVYEKLLQNKMEHLSNSTYDVRFNDFFGRTIEQKKLVDIVFQDKIFVKPVLNTKLFSGTIIENNTQLEILKNNFGKIDVYISNIIDIEGEYRLLIGNNKLYGSSHMKGSYDEKYLDAINVDQLIKLVGKDYMCVDMGITKNNKCILVEINPPYSLDSYDIELDKYFEFCIDACEYFSSNNFSSNCD